MNDRDERRTDHALRRRIDQLLGRVRAAREEIVERGLDAVQDTKEQDADAGKEAHGARPPEPRGRRPAAADEDDAAA